MWFDAEILSQQPWFNTRQGKPQKKTKEINAVCLFVSHFIN